MFYGASFLHKGIPVNFFGSTELPRITSLAYMFGMTSVIYDVENASNKWITATTIEPLINLDNISGLFYRNNIDSSINQFPTTYGTMNNTVTDIEDNEVAIIATDTFTTKTISNITKLFEHTVYNPPARMGGFRFTGFSVGTDAFFSSSFSNIDVNFVDSLYVSSIINANRMFYQSITGARYHDSVTNLATFVNDLVSYPNTSKNNIAGNMVDSDIPAQYKDSTVEGDAIVFYGFGLQVPTDPEASWSNYGRYIYS
jgi:hypothetical protein